ncbi:MAG: DUF975 family protein [Clostridia bacterium]|nr:DUF975 family protein [Clostridia bacterium]MBR4799867.1 DUF975 family protein [Clostridia bacterium]
MLSRAELKTRAKQQLGGSLFANVWLYALLVLLIVSVILSFAGSFTFGIVTVLVEGPLAVGVAGLFIGLVRGANSIKIEDMFNGFKDNLSRNLLLGLLQSLFIFLWSLLFVIPGIIKYYAYSMSFYIANDHPEYDWKQCLDESKRITNGHKWELFVLDLSFIGWYIVGSLALGLGVLWVAPYHAVTIANYYEALKNA